MPATPPSPSLPPISFVPATPPSPSLPAFALIKLPFIQAPLISVKEMTANFCSEETIISFMRGGQAWMNFLTYVTFQSFDSACETSLILLKQVLRTHV